MKIKMFYRLMIMLGMEVISFIRKVMGICIGVGRRFLLVIIVMVSFKGRVKIRVMKELIIELKI